MKTHSKLENTQEKECYICLEIITIHQKIARQNCVHKTHLKCYKRWIKSIHNKKGTTCPLCGAAYLNRSSRECFKKCLIS